MGPANAASHFTVLKLLVLQASDLEDTAQYVTRRAGDFRQSLVIGRLIIKIFKRYFEEGIYGGRKLDKGKRTYTVRPWEFCCVEQGSLIQYRVSIAPIQLSGNLSIMASNDEPGLRAVYLEPRLRKFIDLHQNIPLSQINASTTDIRRIIRAFYPDIVIRSCARRKHLIKIFEALVRPCFDNFEVYEGGTATMYYRPVNFCKCQLFSRPVYLMSCLRTFLRVLA